MSSVVEDTFDAASVGSSVQGSPVEGPGRSADDDNGERPMLGSMSDPPKVGSVARAVAANFHLPNLQPHEHSGLFYLSLIEGRCRTQATNSVNAGRRREDQVAEDHPEVRDLAHHLFAEMSSELSKTGILPHEFAGHDLAELRSNYLTSFDTLLHQIAAKRTHIISAHGSYRAIHDSEIVPVSKDSTIPELGISQALATTRLKMAAAPKEPRKTYPEGRQSPLSSFILGDHQGKLITKSIYATEYQELSLLGRGGFGHVYMVRNIVDDQMYAVKKIVITSERLRMVSEKDQVKSLLLEVRTLAKLHHTNVVRYYHGWVESRPASATTTGPNRGLLADGEYSWRSSDSGCELESESNSGSGSANSIRIEDLHLGLERELTKEMQQLGDLANYNEYDDNVVFGHSSSSVGHTGSHPTAGRDLLLSHAAGAVGTRKTSIHSVGKDDTDDGEETEDIQRIERGSQPPQIGSDLILFIKMSVHPLALEEFLSPDPPVAHDTNTIRHCFHTFSSARILSAILDGVEYIHSQRIVHRDLKPANVFLSIHHDRMPSFEGSIDIMSCPECGNANSKKRIFITPCIGDFGLIAELKDLQPGTSATSCAGELFEPSTLAVLASRQTGTTLYCPPTMPRKEPIICPKLDVFSLGVIAFELIYKFNTKSERGVVLGKLNKGIFPQGFEKHKMASGIKSMVCGDRDKRWDCSEVRQWLKGMKGAFD